MSLHDPERFAQIVRGMINIQQHQGKLLADRLRKYNID
jgi:hypothetical protein